MWLWIDQICIDQSNTHEKNQQVAIMSKIYSKAYIVLSWLGPRSPTHGTDGRSSLFYTPMDNPGNPLEQLRVYMLRNYLARIFRISLQRPLGGVLKKYSQSDGALYPMPRNNTSTSR